MEIDVDISLYVQNALEQEKYIDKLNSELDTFSFMFN
jgi:hypothetical protein